MTIDWGRFAERIRARRNFVLISHVRPDCDALGSELGFAMILEALGKEVRIVNGQPTPPHLAFLDPRHRIQAINVDVAPRELKSADCFMVLDTSAWVQLGDMAPQFRETEAERLILDHHQAGDTFEAEIFRDVTAEATGRLVVDAAKALGVPLTKEMAVPLFAAIATDTGWFRFSSVTSRTYEAAAELVAAGAVPQDLYRILYEQESLARLHLMGRVTSRAKFEKEGRVGHLSISAEDFAQTGSTPADTDDFVNLLLKVKGAQVAMMFVELTPNEVIKASFRSRSSLFDCSKLAAGLGGGGHKAAAGATLYGTLESARAKVLAAVFAALDAPAA